MDMMHVGISAEERSKFRNDHPGDFSIGIGVVDQRDGGQSVHDVAERARLDDQYLFQMSAVRLSILSANRKSFREWWREAGLDDFLLRGGDLVFYAPLLDDVVLHVINAVGGAPITVARLTDTAGINEILFVRLDPEQLGSDASDAVIADKGARHMSMAKETNGRVLIGETRSRVEIVEDVTPSCRGIEGGVDDGKIAHLALQAQVAQPRFVLCGKVIARPFDSALSKFIEV